MSYDKESVGKRLKAYREAMGLTQKQFIEPIGDSQSAIAMWETGARYPSIKSAYKMWLHYSLSSDFLFFGKRDSLPVDISKKIDEYL